MTKYGTHPLPDPVSDESHRPSAGSLTDDDITAVMLDRRSFLARTMVAGSLGLTAAVTAGCVPEESSDADSASTDADEASPEATGSESSDADGVAR